MPTTAITKVLSPNDVGATGSHQAGILVPKNPQILSFFPPLDRTARNPRQTLSFIDDDKITHWDFQYIYYNNKLFGGTRNEYRLTGMTMYLRSKAARAGDEVHLSRDRLGGLQISYNALTSSVREPDVIILSGGWKVISTRKR
jgi:hypothetical protein